MIKKNAFPNIMSAGRPEYKFNGIPNPFWISGFASGDSLFSVSIEKSTTKLGRRVRLIFGTCLHIREKDLLIGLANYFNNLNSNYSNSSEINNNKKISIYSNESNNTSLLQIKNNFDIENKIIPFFIEYPILGVKKIRF